MHRQIRNVFLISLIGSAPALAQDISFKATEVTDGLYMLEGVGGFAGGNLGLSVGDDGLVLIDDSMAPLSEVMFAAIREVSAEPIEFVINTHVHGDHTGGNVAVTEAGATVVAHDNIRKRLIDNGIATPEGNKPAPDASLPVLTFSDAVTFHLNGHETHVFHIASAHTDGDGSIHFRNANVIHTGDIMFNGMFPFIDLDSGGTVDGYIAAQEQLLAMCDEETKLIPGHGPLAGAADLEASIAMLKDARSRIQALVDAGKSEDETVAENPLADYHADWDWGFITTERMTRQVYRGLTQ